MPGPARALTAGATLALALFPLLAAGCGKPAATQTRPRGPKPAAQTPLPVVMPSGPPPAAGSPAEAVARAVAGMRAMTAYEFQMRWSQKAGAKRSQGVYAVEGMAPRTTRITITEGESQGTKILYKGGDKARVRLGGLLGAVALDLPVDDERLRSIRGYTIAQVDLPALLGMLGDPRHQATFVGPGVVGLTGGPLLPGVARAEVALDAAGLPSRIVFHDAKEAVYKIELRDVRRASHAVLEI